MAAYGLVEFIFVYGRLDLGNHDIALVGTILAVVVAQILGQRGKTNSDQCLALQDEYPLQCGILVNRADVTPDRMRKFLNGLGEKIGAGAEDQVAGLQIRAHVVIRMQRQLRDFFLGKVFSHVVDILEECRQMTLGGFRAIGTI